MSEVDLQSENEKLRAEVETYRQRELAELRTALIAAREASEHYRSEAHRNADLARQIDANAQETITRLKTEIETLRRAKQFARTIRSPSGAGT